ncbi:tigger transposable element-derived protein 4-like [Melanaphis sacchari]|uniref:tigger transposable element-derived protein 4-like n=1 Tax=Melanaphis sacchari TaxID=742174 RepID=UPI000DC135E5|nr:tigger transposable element-derived protein 4-like [Melanaphis sacchari]
MSPYVPRKTLNLKQKVDIIHFKDSSEGWSIRKLAEKFGIGKTQVAEILKNKENILRRYKENSRRFQRNGPGELIDKIVLEWFNHVRNKNVPLSGPIIQAKALEVAREIECDDFKASNSWLESFKVRHNLVFKSICGESTSTNLTIVNKWKSKISEIMIGYEPQNIFNAYETGLFYRALPDKTFSYKGESCSGGKIAKERLTILLCVSMSGEKLKPLVIGKSVKPRCFKGIDISKLEVEWKANSKAWMTTHIMTNWLQRLDQQMKIQNRKILLFLYNVTSHAHLSLDNVTLIFFPPNITSTFQPLDQGIIKNFKVFYRKFALQHIIANLDNTRNAHDLAKQIDVLKAIIWVKKAWTEISSFTITNCFKKAEFPFSEPPEIENEVNNNELIKLMEFLPLPRNDDFATIVSNLSTECSSDEIAMILNNIQTELNLMDTDDEQQADDQLENSEVKTFKNYSEALE